MRKCKNCGQEIPENIAFCPECGTKQEPVVPVSTPPAPPPAVPPVQNTRAVPPANVPNRSQMMSAGTGGINVDMLGKAAYLGALLVIVSSFLPLVSVLGGLGSVSVSDISGLVTVCIIAFAVIAGYFQAQGQVDIMPIVGTGLLLLLAIGFVEYNSAMNEFSKLVGASWNAAAKAAFSFSAGFYAFTLGSILMCIGGSGCLAHKLGLSLDFAGILEGWKNSLQRTVVLGSLNLPGWIVSLLVTGILALVIKNIKL